VGSTMLTTKTVRLAYSTAILWMGLTCCLHAESPGDVRPSAYAPVNDLKSQVQYFLRRIDKVLADEFGYDKDRQAQVEKDASTLAVIGLVLTLHDESNDSRSSAPALLEAAQELADASGDIGDARAALANAKVTTTASRDAGKIEWEPVADLAILMQQVPIINNSLRRVVNGRRFKRSVDRAAGLAATLAALAHVSAFDTDYCDGKDEERIWREICNGMRDSAARVNTAVRAVDQKAAQRGLEQLVESCDKCHHRFRD